MTPPPVSIGMPVYNGERYLPEAIRSLLEQHFGDFELLISDNASTDGTEEISRDFAKHDQRIRYVRQTENLGAAENYNFVMRQSTGDLFKWAAHDDICLPAFLGTCVEALEEYGTAAVIAFPKTRWIDSEGARIGDYDLEIPWHKGVSPAARLRDLFADPIHSYLHRCSPALGLMRSTVLRTTRLIGKFNSSDKTLLLEMALRGDFVEVPEYLFLRRIHEENSLAANASPEEVARWFDPKAGEQFPMPETRLYWSYLSAVMGAPLSFRQRVACLSQVFRCSVKRCRVIAGEFKLRLRTGLR